MKGNLPGMFIIKRSIKFMVFVVVDCTFKMDSSVAKTQFKLGPYGIIH